MRPGSGMRLGSAGGRPGSGKPPGTGRLRTGVAPSGSGTIAGQGSALNAEINVSERPVTGQGVKGMKAQVSGGGRVVYDASYYVGVLRKKISDVNNETIKLRGEIDQQSKDNSQYSSLERRYENLIKNKEMLEGQLADYNLALDKTRTSTDPEDVQHMAYQLSEKNRQTGQDLDRIFAQRKQREQETFQIEEQMEDLQRNVQRRINELEPGKVRAYNDLLTKQRELQDRALQSENRLNEINTKIRSYESDDKSNALRKEFLNLERTFQTLRKETDSFKEELEIANMDPKEAHAKFVARVNDFKQGTKKLEEKAAQLREEISQARRNLDDLESNQEEDSGEMAKYELLVKRDQDMTAFMDSFDESRANIVAEQKQAQFLVQKALEHISKGLDDTENMPSIDGMGEMENAKTFKEKNLATAQRTMESLLAEKKKREKEIDLLRTSEPKLVKELSSLREQMATMRAEMDQFENIDQLRREFDETQLQLQDMRSGYIKRRETMRQQVQSVSMEHEALKKQLNSNEIAREIDDTEKRLKHFERSIFELREFVDTKSRETDYEGVKAICLKLVDTANSQAIKNANGTFGGGYK